MALLRIREFPDRILREKSKKIRKIDSSIQKLASDMVETMHHEGGVGLAANQVGILKRLCVIQIPDEDEEARILINPEVIEAIGERRVEEGCLSVPGYRGYIFRSESVKVRAQNHHGKYLKIQAEGLLAQALEHEIDHLNGILYLDHLRAHEDLHKVGEETDETHRHESHEPVEAEIG